MSRPIDALRGKAQQQNQPSGSYGHLCTRAEGAPAPVGSRDAVMSHELRHGELAMSGRITIEVLAALGPGPGNQGLQCRRRRRREAAEKW